MKLTVLGCHGTFARRGACSSYLVSHEGTNILLDMGNGSLANFLEAHSISGIDAIFLSHLHYDHMSDIQILKYAIGQSRMRGFDIPQIPLYLPGSPQEVFQTVTAGGDCFSVTVIHDFSETVVGNMKVVCSQMTHPVESYGFEIFSGGAKIAYTGDTTLNDNVYKLAYNADIFLADGGLLEIHGGKNAPHMTAACAGKAGAKARRTIVTHLSPVYSELDIISELTENSELAEEGKTYEVL